MSDYCHQTQFATKPIQQKVIKNSNANFDITLKNSLYFSTQAFYSLTIVYIPNLAFIKMYNLGTDTSIKKMLFTKQTNNIFIISFPYFKKQNIQLFTLVGNIKKLQSFHFKASHELLLNQREDQLIGNGNCELEFWRKTELQWKFQNQIKKENFQSGSKCIIHHPHDILITVQINNNWTRMEMYQLNFQQTWEIYQIIDFSEKLKKNYFIVDSSKLLFQINKSNYFLKLQLESNQNQEKKYIIEKKIQSYQEEQIFSNLKFFKLHFYDLNPQSFEVRKVSEDGNKLILIRFDISYLNFKQSQMKIQVRNKINSKRNWEYKQFTQILFFKQHESMAINNDGSFLVIGFKKSISIYQRKQSSFEFFQSIWLIFKSCSQVYFMRKTNQFIVVYTDHTLEFWICDSKNNKFHLDSQISALCYILALGYEDRLIVTGGQNSIVFFQKKKQWEKLQEIKTENQVSQLCIDQSETKIIYVKDNKPLIYLVIKLDNEQWSLVHSYKIESHISFLTFLNNDQFFLKVGSQKIRICKITPENTIQILLKFRLFVNQQLSFQTKNVNLQFHSPTKKLIFNRQKFILITKQGKYTMLLDLKKIQNGELQVTQMIKAGIDHSLSEDGEYLATFGPETKQFEVRKFQSF
ncbi:unnamed protein product [Paramecium sonneborni]|uniref:Uncharacterized protein n=1 Tax=Paramecium sonneborni TaxID=65129 RepID=A0A8S1MMD9_9CILI|nr:unnamed protein product [Paramecium sonneborni]